MKTPSLRRIVSNVARSFAEAMVMTDPLVYSCYLRCQAEADDNSSTRLGARPNKSQVAARVPVVPAELTLYPAAD